MATINIAELANELDTDARTARKFMRAVTDRDAQPGKGSRWEIEKREVRSLKSKFKKFQVAQEEAKQERAAKKAKEAAESPETFGDDPYDPADDEPTAEDLAAIENEA